MNLAGGDPTCFLLQEEGLENVEIQGWNMTHWPEENALLTV